jgi:hypothetical protein
MDTDEGSILRITDEVSLPDRDKWLKKFGKKTDLASFDVFGYYYPLLGSNNLTGAGFIRDMKFNTTVPPNLATMITVGATANGYVVGQDATALSRMNAGLEDRFKEKIVLPTEQDIQTASSSSINQDYVTALTDFNVFVSELGLTKGSSTAPIWNKEAISAFNTTAAQFYEYDQAKQTLGSSKEALGQVTASIKPWEKPASPNGGFLPFDLALTMDGLSGMKIYQKYTIDTTYLPSNYPNSLEFLIKGITNTIQNNQWITDIESFAIPKNPFGSSVALSPASSASNPSSRGTEPPFTGSTPNANALRTILASLGYTEKGKELSNGGDITPELVKYASSVLKEIKKQLPTLQIRITGGNDKFHQNLSKKSSHTRGQGLDLAITPDTTANKKAVDTILGGFAAGNKNQSVSFINEYDYPSAKASGGHFHLRIGGTIEGATRINNFYTLANQGKLTTYPIA